jgi:hypothetical protein
MQYGTVYKRTLVITTTDFPEVCLALGPYQVIGPAGLWGARLSQAIRQQLELALWDARFCGLAEHTHPFDAHS